MYYSKHRAYFSSSDFAEITAIAVFLVVTAVFMFSRTFDISFEIDVPGFGPEPVPVPPVVHEVPPADVKPSPPVIITGIEENEDPTITDDPLNFPTTEFVWQDAPPLNPPKETFDDDEIVPYFGMEEPPVLSSAERTRLARAVFDNYPQLAKLSGMSGKAVVGFICSKEGVPVSLKIISEEPEGLGFGEAAVKAVSQIRFTPGYQNDVPVRVRMSIPVSFITK